MQAVRACHVQRSAPAICLRKRWIQRGPRCDARALRVWVRQGVPRRARRFMEREHVVGSVRRRFWHLRVSPARGAYGRMRRVVSGRRTERRGLAARAAVPLSRPATGAAFYLGYVKYE